MELRKLNEGIDYRREDLFTDYLEAKYASFKLHSLEDYETLRRVNEARSKTQSRFVRDNLMDNLPTKSNGEHAFQYFTEKIGEGGLYLLDEPENSLSPAMQLRLKAFIEESVRYFGCQFIIATHSPFLLALEGAKIYDFDQNPITLTPWKEVENIKVYRQFFKDL